MDQTPTARRVSGRSPLPFIANLILAAWMVVGVALTWWFLVINGDSGEDWQDLVILVAAGLMAIAFVAVAVSWLVARYALRSTTSRVVMAAVGPPSLVALIPIVLWLL